MGGGRSTTRAVAVAEGLEGRTLLAADAVLDWNAATLDAIRVDGTPPPAAARDMAVVQLAVYNAVIGVEGGSRLYRMDRKAPKGASAPLAAAVAAHDVLSSLFPAQSDTFDAKLAGYQAQSGGLSTRAAKKTALWGSGCAAAVLRQRKNDGATESKPYTFGSGPGVYQPTPPTFSTSPVLPNWGSVKPFALRSATQFKVPGPPALDSAAYTSAYDEVQAVGGTDSTVRTADQTAIAAFWADQTAHTSTPPGHWNEIAAVVAQDRNNTLAQNARLFALLDVAEADAGIACWGYKYQYNSWRPVTAIRFGDTDGNPATAADPNWAPLWPTPPFPSYLSGHSTFSAAAAAVLAGFYGTDSVSFTVGDDALPGITRSYESFSSAAAEAGQSRVYGGIHFQFDNQDGLALGKEIGDYVLGHALRPAGNAFSKQPIASAG